MLLKESFLSIPLFFEECSSDTYSVCDSKWDMMYQLLSTWYTPRTSSMGPGGRRFKVVLFHVIPTKAYNADMTSSCFVYIEKETPDQRH